MKTTTLVQQEHGTVVHMKNTTLVKNNTVKLYQNTTKIVQQ